MNCNADANFSVPNKPSSRIDNQLQFCLPKSSNYNILSTSSPWFHNNSDSKVFLKQNIFLQEMFRGKLSTMFTITIFQSMKSFYLQIGNKLIDQIVIILV